MRTRSLLIAILALALMAPVAVSATTPAGNAVVAKKKKKASYCAKAAKKKKARAAGKVKSAKFFLYTVKSPSGYLFCSESPKFNGTISISEGIQKTSHLRARKNNCAVFYSEEKDDGSSRSGEKALRMVSAKYFRKGSKLGKQTHASILGAKQDVIAMEGLALSSNCVFAAGYTVNGKPTLSVAGTGDFAYQGHIRRDIPGATAAELKAVKITVVSPGAVQVSWTQAGVPKTLDYPGTNN
jgi:hypothetical protein